MPVKKNKNKLLLILLLQFLFLPTFIYAQDPDPIVTEKIDNPININNVNDFIKVILEGVIKIGIPVVAVAFVYSGFLFVSAMGNPEKLKTAKNAFIYTLIGAAILLGSWALAQLVSDTVLNLG